MGQREVLTTSSTGMNTNCSPRRFSHSSLRKWTKLLDALSDEGTVSESHKVTTKTELNRLLSRSHFGKVITLVEVVVPMFDAPPVLRRYRQ